MIETTMGFRQLTQDFIWRMEAVLNEYARPYDEKEPSVCFNECPCQLLADVYPVQALQPGQVRRYDYEYEPLGNCNLFMMFQLLAGWRCAKVTAHRKKEDFAECLRKLVDVHFPTADCIHVVLDHLSAHSYFLR